MIQVNPHTEKRGAQFERIEKRIGSIFGGQLAFLGSIFLVYEFDMSDFSVSQLYR